MSTFVVIGEPDSKMAKAYANLAGKMVDDKENEDLEGVMVGEKVGKPDLLVF